MRRITLFAVAALLAGVAVAIAQPGGGETPDGEAIAAEAKSFGECVSTAAQAGVENPTEACAELRPVRTGDPRGSDENGRSNHAKACEEREKRDGAFGRCVSERASAFGRCVADQAGSGAQNPTAACADLKPGNGGGNGNGNGANGDQVSGNAGPPEGVPTGKPEGTPQGPPGGVPQGKPEGAPSGPPSSAPSGKPEGTPSGPPEGVPPGKPEGTPGGPAAGRPGG
jgi:hypothetical protein